jgi:hypothetical protein
MGKRSLNGCELAGERFFNANSKAIRTRIAVDEPPNAKCSRCQRGCRPNCLDIQTSIDEDSANVEIRSEVQAEKK